jgi:cytoskeletal protein RodZ
MKKLSFKNHRILFILIIVILISIGTIIFITSNNKSKVSTAKIGITHNPVNTSSSTTSTQSPANNSVDSSPNKNPSAPQAPSGNFISSYSANLNTQEQSECDTTAGATCTISFTNNGTTKSLPATQATASPKNPNGAFASWNWQPSALGLTPGSWTVSATATLNGQSIVTKSSLLLELAQ